MRLGVVVLILLFAAFGATFGALNAERVVFDIYFTKFGLPKGAALIAALLVGWALGGLVVWSLRVLRLKHEVRVARRALAELRAQIAAAPGAGDSAVDGT